MSYIKSKPYHHIEEHINLKDEWLDYFKAQEGYENLKISLSGGVLPRIPVISGENHPKFQTGKSKAVQ